MFDTLVTFVEDIASEMNILRISGELHETNILDRLRQAKAYISIAQQKQLPPSICSLSFFRIDFDNNKMSDIISSELIELILLQSWQKVEFKECFGHEILSIVLAVCFKVSIENLIISHEFDSTVALTIGQGLRLQQLYQQQQQQKQQHRLLHNEENIKNNNDDNDNAGNNTCQKAITLHSLSLFVPFTVATCQALKDGLSQNNNNNDDVTPIVSLKEIDFSGSSFIESIQWNGNFTTNHEGTASIVRLLANTLKNHATNITTLKFNGCRLQDWQVAILIKIAINNHPTLETLDLDVNACSTQTLQELSTTFRQNNSTSRSKLSWLRMSHPVLNQDRINGLSDFFGSLSNNKLSVLHLSYYMIHDEDIQILLEASPSFITELRLKSCGITQQGYKILASGLSKLPRLKHLQLPQHDFNDNNTVKKYFYNALQNNYTLESLQFGTMTKLPNEMTFLLAFNAAGRYLLYDMNTTNNNRKINNNNNGIPASLWPFVLAKINQTKPEPRKVPIHLRTSIMYNFLRNHILLER